MSQKALPGTPKGPRDPRQSARVARADDCLPSRDIGAHGPRERACCEHAAMEAGNPCFARRPRPTAAELLVPSAPGVGPLLRASAGVERQSSKSDMATKRRGERLRAATSPTIWPQAPPIVDVEARLSIRSERSASPTVKLRCSDGVFGGNDTRQDDERDAS